MCENDTLMRPDSSLSSAGDQEPFLWVPTSMLSGKASWSVTIDMEDVADDTTLCSMPSVLEVGMAVVLQRVCIISIFYMEI